MTEIRSAQDLEKLIGYTFRNKQILAEATIRRAYLNENPTQDEECMDPLATLGDAVLGTVVVAWLYGKGKRTKKDLTDLRKNLVNRERTRAFAEENKFHKYIQWGEGELKQEQWSQGNKALDTVTEALIGAIFLDAVNCGENGLKSVQEFLERKKFFRLDSS